VQLWSIKASRFKLQTETYRKTAASLTASYLLRFSGQIGGTRLMLSLRANNILIALKSASGELFEIVCDTAETNIIDPGNTSVFQWLRKSNISIGDKRQENDNHVSVNVSFDNVVDWRMTPLKLGFPCSK